MTKNSIGYGTRRYKCFICQLGINKIKNQKHLQDINMFSTSLKPRGILKVKGLKKAVFTRRKLNIR